MREKCEGHFPQTVQPEKREKTTLKNRFSGFALYHFGVSLLLGCGSLVILSPIFDMMAESDTGRFLFAVIVMTIYVPLGMAASANRRWTAPDTVKEMILAVMQPAVVAWFWVGIVLLTLGNAALDGLFIEFILSMFFAAPSSLFVLSSIEWWGYGTRLGEILALALIGGVAGFLPPFLFALGSFWQSARMERKGTS